MNVPARFIMAIVVLSVLFLLTYPATAAQSTSESVPDPAQLEILHNREWSKIKEMGSLAEVLWGAPIVPTSGPLVLEQLLSSGRTPYGAPYKRLVNVASAEALQAALDAAQPGDFIQLADGIYRGNFSAKVSGTAPDRITLYGSRGAVIEGDSLDSGYGFLLAADYWVLTGFSVRNVSKGIMTERANYNILHGLEIYRIGDEGVHFRKFSSDNRITHSWVHDVGLVNPEFGEAIYIGSAVSNWVVYSDGRPDMSDRNQVVGNLLGPNVPAEGIDIKEGTTGAAVQNNTFINTSNSVVDTWIDIKGNRNLVSYNGGLFNPEDGIQTGVSINEEVAGWGQNNIVEGNQDYTATSAVRLPFRTAFSQTGVVGIVLPERSLPYSLSELIARFPQSFEQVDADAILLKESIIAARGANLKIDTADVTKLHLLSSPEQFVAITTFRGNLTIVGTPDQPLEFQSWDPTLKAADTDLETGRAYVLAWGGRMDIEHASFSDLGFGEGAHSGVGWRSITWAGATEVVRGNVVYSQFARNYFGAYTFEAVEMHWQGNTFANNIVYGFDPHDYSNDFIVEDNIVYGSGKHGIIFSRGCDRNIIRNNQSYDNLGHGIMIDDGKVEPGSSNIRYLEPVPSDANVIENNRVWNNQNGIVIEGGVGNIIRNNEIGGAHVYGVRLKDDVSETLIVNNTILAGAEIGVFIHNHSDNNLIEDNVITAERGGIVIEDSISNRVKSNSINEVLGASIRLYGNVTNSTITNNTLVGVGEMAIDGAAAYGIDLRAALRDNDVTDWHFTRPGYFKFVRSGMLGLWLFIFLVPIVMIVIIRMRNSGSSLRPAMEQ
jgi:parallel beta-helix repeat protein